MIQIKSEQEMQMIIEGGALLGQVLEKLAQMVAPGVSGFTIDAEAERLIIEAGGVPAFKGYKSRRSDPPFPGTICFSLNEEVVHGIPTKKKMIKAGDLVSIDIGMQYPANSGLGKHGHGFYTDTAITVIAGKASAKIKKLVKDTQVSLYKGIAQVQLGRSIADIGKAVEGYLDPKGYGIVEDLVGHGVGYDLHEDPIVPNYHASQLRAIKMKTGFVIAIEPMVTLGTHKVETAADGWSISTIDKSLSAHFEHTVVLTKDGPIVATKRPSEIISL